MIYLFLGQDELGPDGVSRKDAALAKIKEKFLDRSIEEFNLDILYANELSLLAFQERFLSLPVGSGKRIIVIKEAHALEKEIRDFILKQAKNFPPQIMLVLDIIRHDPRDQFLREITSSAKTLSFKAAIRIDTFTLAKAIEARRPDHALRVLNQLLDNGEKPERILGGLRYSWGRDYSYPLETRRRMKLLLSCDLEIKTGKLKPFFALEKAVVSLCSLPKAWR
ncbi:MAG: hypothetical protein WC510_06065 [Candidatus Omnitrophota bacterium]